ncbi:MAG TPA: sulfotransferase [Kofleriaceae bacterium]|nr:sulfotransferase [Kofleriaceae bacterium]
MSLKVVGAGVGRTGTMSLKLALEKLLGAPCYHMVEVFANNDFAHWTAAGRGERVDWPKLLGKYAAAVDWPASAFWPELAAQYPDAMILLSTRDAEGWFKSATDTIFAFRQPPPPPMREMLDVMPGSRFTSAVRDHDAAIAAYEKHNAHVRATAPRDRLVEWHPGDGWGPLCAALKLPVPSEPFPHVNTTEEFKARVINAAPGQLGRPH